MIDLFAHSSVKARRHIRRRRGERLSLFARRLYEAHLKSVVNFLASERIYMTWEQQSEKVRTHWLRRARALSNRQIARKKKRK